MSGRAGGPDVAVTQLKKGWLLGWMSSTQTHRGAPKSLVQAQDGGLESDLREGRHETRDRDLSEASHRKEEEERKVAKNLQVASVTF